MTYSENVLATAEGRDEARLLARSLPRPNSVRQVASGQWVVVQLLPAKWEPAAVHSVTG